MFVSKRHFATLACTGAVALTAGCGSSSPSGGASSSGGTASSLCGSKAIKLGMVDGSTNSFLKIAEAEVKAKYASCSNITINYQTANNSADAYNAAVNADAAQGFDAIITNDSVGDQGLSSLKAAYQAGLVVVPYINVPTGDPGTTFTSAVHIGLKAEADKWANWLNKQLNGSGNIIFMGGPAGNPASQTAFDMLKQSLATTAPNIKFLEDAPVTTGWDPAVEQKAMAGLITKYPKIDAIVADYGGAALGSIRAFQTASVPVPPLATTALNNEFGCSVAKIKTTSPNFQLMSVDGVVRISAVAAGIAIQAVHSQSKQVPAVDFTDFIIWDTTGSNPPKCDPSLPPDADLSSSLSASQLAKVFG